MRKRSFSEVSSSRDLTVVHVWPDALSYLSCARFHDLHEAYDSFGGAFISTRAAAGRLGTTRELVRHLAARKLLAHVQLSNGRILVSRRDIERERH